MIEPKQLVKNIIRLGDTEVRRGFTCLDRNERVYPFQPQVMAELLAQISVEDLMRYPILEPFYHKMAHWLGIDRQELLLSYGSDGAIRSVFDVYINPGDHIVMPQPTYAMYTVYANLFGATVSSLAYDRNFNLTVDQFCEAITSATRLVILPNPNAPTGTLFSSAEVEIILQHAHKCQSLVLVDEAYYYFCEQTALPQVAKYDNMLVTRTFSKAAGLAGLRIGYVVGQSSLIEYLRKVKPIYELNGVALRLAEYMIDHEQLMWNHVQQVRAGQIFLKEKFTTKGLTVFECPTNFMIVRLPQGVDRAALVNRLAAEKYLVKGSFTDPCLVDCLRVTLGDVATMSGFWSHFERLYDELSS